MKKRVFLTGATGVMGSATLNELLARNEKFEITVLVRDSKTNREKMAKYGDKIRIVWGDLLCYDDVLKGVSGADYVLHIGGMVSPSADYKPKSVLKVNVEADFAIEDYYYNSVANSEILDNDVSKSV